MMNKPVKVLIWATFVAYWAITLLFNTPDNFLKVKADPLLRNFEKLFAQKWSFFAPPPKGNHRLYYTYFDQDTTPIETFEVLRKITTRKYENLPFNSREEAIDYMVSGSIINIIDNLVQVREITQVQFPDTSAVDAQMIAMAKLNETSNHISSYQTLLNYGELVKDQNLSPSDQSKASFFQFKVSEVMLPKFINRSDLLDEDRDAREDLVFQSGVFKIKRTVIK